MATDESLHRTKPRTRLTDMEEAEKWRKIDEYRKPFLDAIRCKCHCHTPHPEGVQCRCIKNCAHCRSTRIEAGEES